MGNNTKESKSYLSEDRVTDATIHHELLLLICIERRNIFNGPVAMPNGTRSNRSRIFHSATENDSLVPM